jgi:hypothetical protein
MFLQNVDAPGVHFTHRHLGRPDLRTLISVEFEDPRFRGAGVMERTARLLAPGIGPRSSSALEVFSRIRGPWSKSWLDGTSLYDSGPGRVYSAQVWNVRSTDRG